MNTVKHIRDDIYERDHLKAFENALARKLIVGIGCICTLGKNQTVSCTMYLNINLPEKISMC